jgi:hypothetical protein
VNLSETSRRGTTCQKQTPCVEPYPWSALAWPLAILIHVLRNSIEMPPLRRKRIGLVKVARLCSSMSALDSLPGCHRGTYVDPPPNACHPPEPGQDCGKAHSIKPSCFVLQPSGHDSTCVTIACAPAHVKSLPRRTSSPKLCHDTRYWCRWHEDMVGYLGSHFSDHYLSVAVETAHYCEAVPKSLIGRRSQ